MSSSEKEMWESSIEDAASRVTAEYGSAVAASVFERHGAHNFEDLSPIYYSEVFADLQQIATDN